MKELALLFSVLNMDGEEDQLRGHRSRSPWNRQIETPQQSSLYSTWCIFDIDVQLEKTELHSERSANLGKNREMLWNSLELLFPQDKIRNYPPFLKKSNLRYIINGYPRTRDEITILSECTHFFAFHRSRVFRGEGILNTPNYFCPPYKVKKDESVDSVFRGVFLWCFHRYTIEKYHRYKKRPYVALYSTICIYVYIHIHVIRLTGPNTL